MKNGLSAGARTSLRLALASTVIAFAPRVAVAAQPTSQPQPGAAPAPPVIYPSKGQTQDQMERDKTECYGWARQQTGYDPAAVAQAQAPAQGAPQEGGAARGAAKGAAGGAAIGAIGGSPGTGAAAGAAAGAAGSAARRRKEEAAQQQSAAQQQQANAQMLAQYQKAFGACMEGRGYAVK